MLISLPFPTLSYRHQSGHSSCIGFEKQPTDDDGFDGDPKSRERKIVRDLIVFAWGPSWGVMAPWGKRDDYDPGE